MKSLIVALSAVAFTTPAFALSDAAEYAALLAKSNTTLNQASNAAAAHLNGQTVSAELDSHRGQVVFDVEVLAGGRLYDVTVDAQDGTVIDSREDKE